MSHQKIKIALIGGEGAGKCTIGNVILGKRHFKRYFFIKTIMKGKTKEKQRKTKVYRVPGWSGDLTIRHSGQKMVREQIVRCVKKNPHAIVWVISMDQHMSTETVKSLELLLTPDFWTYTVVVFTYSSVKEHPLEAIDTYIRSHDLQDIWDKCGERITAICTGAPAPVDSAELLKVIDNMLETNPSAFEMPTQSATTLQKMCKRPYRTQDEIDDTQAIDGNNYKKTLVFVLEDLGEREFKKFKSFLADADKTEQIPRGQLEGKSPVDIADLIMKTWPDRRQITYVRDLLKTIQRNDLEKHLRPYLKNVGESW